jgi:hypothetical protein
MCGQVIPAFRRQKDHEFKANLGYTKSLSQNKANRKTEKQ